MEARLNNKLQRLKRKYKAGFDITKVIWEPTAMHLRPPSGISDEVKTLSQRIHDPINMSRWIIVIYEQCDVEQAIHNLHHEFIEHLVMKPAHTFVELSNVMLRLINRLQYETQEDVVETLAKLEDDEYAKGRKKDD